LTGCAPFYGDDYDEVVDKNLKAELNYNFEEIGLKLESSTLDLLKGLLKKVPKSRLSASEALKHPAFDLIDSNKNVDDDTNVGEHVGLHQNLKEFHEK
jgi:serine/threonine protein kinase